MKGAGAVPGRTARGRDRYRRRHDELVRVAAAVFRETGYDAATVQDVAAELGMLKGSLYYYITSKEDLLFEVVRGVCERLTGATSQAVSGMVDPTDRLRAFLEAHVLVGMEERDALAVLQQDGRALSGDRQDWVTAWRLGHEQAVVDLVSDVAAANDVPHDESSARMLTSSVFGSVSWIPRRYVPDADTAPHVLAARLASFAVAGLLAALLPIPIVTR